MTVTLPAPIDVSDSSAFWTAAGAASKEIGVVVWIACTSVVVGDVPEVPALEPSSRMWNRVHDTYSRPYQGLVGWLSTVMYSLSLKIDVSTLPVL